MARVPRGGQDSEVSYRADDDDDDDDDYDYMSKWL